MITNESLGIIHEKNLNMEPITPKGLLKLGLNYNDINNLIEKNIIKRIRRGIYGITSFEDLFEYGVYLTGKEEYEKAFQIFLKCHEQNSNHLETFEYIFFILLIQNKVSGNQHKFLDKILDINKIKNINNIYLYLLTYNTQGAKKTQINEIKSMKYSDLSLLPIVDTPSLNAYAYNLDTVIEVIGNVDENEVLTPIQKLIIKTLIENAKRKQRKINDKILRLINLEDYEKIVDILKNRENVINLGFHYKAILLLSQKIVEIIKNGKVPKPLPFEDETKNILKLIENNYFAKALRISSRYVESSNSEELSNIIHTLLNKTNELIISIQSKAKLEDIYTHNPDAKDIEDILLYLTQNNIKEATKLIKEYLKQIGKEEYEELIINLIKINIQKGHTQYLTIANILSELKNDEFEYNITFFLEMFYKNLNMNRAGSAKLYLEIIEKYSQGLDKVIISLKNDLTISEERIKEEYDIVREYLLKKISEMKENKQSAIILEPSITYLIRTMIYSTIKNVPLKELRAFSIGKEPKKLVLRYLNPKKTSNINMTERYEYQSAYAQKQYDECIFIIKRLLENCTYDGYNVTIYAYLGLCYYHLNNLEEALKYLTIAHELNNEPKLKHYDVFNFETLLIELRKQVGKQSSSKKDEIEDKFKSLVDRADSRTPQKNEERTIKVRNENTNNDLDDDFGIKNIEDIVYYIQQEKISIDKASQKFSLNNEQLQLVKLIYARDYYIESMYQAGDKLIQEVEKSKNKTPKVRKQLDEIRKNRNFFKHRSNVHTRKRTITSNK